MDTKGTKVSVPLPPGDLNRRTLPLEELPSGRVIYRIHKLGKGPKFFGRSGLHRFDAPDHSYGVLYSGLTPEVAFAETLLRGGPFVALGEVDMRGVCEFRTTVSLRLVHLYGAAMTSINATGGVTSGPEYDISKSWSLAIHGHPDIVDGILYRATYDNDQFSIALFERAANSIDNGTTIEFRNDRVLLGRILDHYKASIR
jgi:hypothetical protein